MKATQIHKRNRALERKGLKRFARYCRKIGHGFMVKRGHGRDGYLDGVPVEVKVNSHTKHRRPGTFPAHISAKQLWMILGGSLLAHVNDRGIFIYDKKAITKRFVSQYAIYLDHDATLTKADLDRHIRDIKSKQR